MSHSQAYPYHPGSSSSSSFGSQAPSYREHTPSLESDRTSTAHLTVDNHRDSPRHSRRYSQRRPISPAERQYVASTMAAAAQAPTPPQDMHDPMRVRNVALGRFFGGQEPSSSSVSQQQQHAPSHYRTHSQTRLQEQREAVPAPQYSSQRSAPILPPYDSRTDIESLPVYTKESEYDAELNRKLFIYGFLFFPLWIVGMIAPFVKPQHDPIKDNRSKEAQDAEDASMRAIELKWAKRCGIALTAFIFVLVIAVVVAVALSHHK